MRTYQDRFRDRKFGIFNHFLFTEPSGGEISPDMTFEQANAAWKKQCEVFDPERIAADLHRIGAGYYFITIMQGTRFMIAPNQTFDRLCGTKPGEACSERDIIADLIVALKKYDIDLCLYYTGDGPYKDEQCGKALGFSQPRGKINCDFIEKWALVLEEYAVRYGEDVKAWWIDGCYDDKFFGYTQELMAPYYQAIKKGNPHALTAFNNGVEKEFYRWYEHEEFTSGEFNHFTHVPDSRFINGAQAHVLLPLGESPNGGEWGGWRKRGMRIDREHLQKYISYVNDIGGVVTLDIFIDNQGRWDDQQLAMLTDLMRS